ncbi:MAG: preprotein translocase subunit SecA [Planctomycetes bacterium]|nr:preprotein translocase subunit SecA [Planctomycetota bacterium]
MAIGSSIKRLAKGMLGTSNEASVKKYKSLVRAVEALEPEILALDDRDLRQKSIALRETITSVAELDKHMAEAFAIARETADRRIGMWNAVRDSSGEFKDAAGWEDQWQFIEAARKQLKDGEQMWDIDLPASVYAHVRNKHNKSIPPYRMRAHDVQVIGAAVLHSGSVAEMKTGEGKTLCACIACYLNAMAVNVHVITVNDYLAKRDAEWNAPVLRFLGITVEALQAEMDPSQRLDIYANKVVYGTNNEFGFDYLRDNLKQSLDEQVQKHHHFAVVDEVDSALIDEARTPLIISGPAASTPEHYIAANDVAQQLTIDDHYEVDIKDRHVTLTEEGLEKAAELFGVDNLYDSETMHMPHFLDNALKAKCLYTKDKEYLIQGRKIKIVDEFTGRVMEGRRWSDGLHQAIEAKEKVDIERESQTYATITLQNYFRMYDKLSGMTGTAMTEAHEFNDIYKLSCVAIPTNKPIIRRDLPDFIYGSEQEKFDAIVEGVEEISACGQPVLVGTASVDVSERLSAAFKKKGLRHNVLNARQHKKEADVIKKAGELGAVTVATNMAGRGTDIVLGTSTGKQVLKHWQRGGMAPKKIKVDSPDLDEAVLDLWKQKFLDDKELEKVKDGSLSAQLEAVNKSRIYAGLYELPMPSSIMEKGLHMRDLGGLRIVGTERHESRRIDNQLRGRSGRQGDPGASRFYLSLDDDLMKRFAGNFMANAMRSMGLRDGVPIESKMVTRAVEKAQKKVEEAHYGMRKRLLEDDQVMNVQRSQVYEQRQNILESDSVDDMYFDFVSQAVDDLVQDEAKDGLRGNELASNISQSFHNITGLDAPAAETVPVKEGGEACKKMLMAQVKETFDARRKSFGDEVSQQILSFILLESIDRNWKDHLYSMDHLKFGISLESYGQKDPRLRFKEEGFRMFMDTHERIRRDVARHYFRVEVQEQAAPAQPTEPVQQAAENIPLAPPRRDKDQRMQAAGFAPRDPLLADQTSAADANTPKAEDPCPCGSGSLFKHCHGDV